MTHFPIAVVLPAGTEPAEVEATVDRLLAPYLEDGNWFADGSRLDWWVIGGRWDGAVQGKDWEPHCEPCRLCDATGIRRAWPADTDPQWIIDCGGCNGCGGTGQSRVWPTDTRYQTIERNLTVLSKMPDDFDVVAVVTPDGAWYERERVGWFGVAIPDEEGREPAEKVGAFDQKLAELRREFSENLVVGVDCHV